MRNKYDRYYQQHANANSIEKSTREYIRKAGFRKVVQFQEEKWHHKKWNKQSKNYRRR